MLNRYLYINSNYNQMHIVKAKDAIAELIIRFLYAEFDKIIKSLSPESQDHATVNPISM